MLVVNFYVGFWEVVRFDECFLDTLYTLPFSWFVILGKLVMLLDKSVNYYTFWL